MNAATLIGLAALSLTGSWKMSFFFWEKWVFLRKLHHRQSTSIKYLYTETMVATIKIIDSLYLLFTSKSCINQAYSLLMWEPEKDIVEKGKIKIWTPSLRKLITGRGDQGKTRLFPQVMWEFYLPAPKHVPLPTRFTKTTLFLSRDKHGRKTFKLV